MLPRRHFLGLGAGMAIYAGPLEDRIRRVEGLWRPEASMAESKTPAVSLAVKRKSRTSKNICSAPPAIRSWSTAHREPARRRYSRTSPFEKSCQAVKALCPAKH